MQPNPLIPPTPAERVLRALGSLQRRIREDVGGDEMKMPFWYLHLPSGERLTVASIRREGPLLLFVGFRATADASDYALVAPEAVAVTIESHPDLEPLAEPLVIDDLDDE